MAKKTETIVKGTELTLTERILLPHVFLKERNFKTLVLQEDILNKIKITQDEIKKYQIEAIGNGAKWNQAGTKAVLTVAFTELEKNEISLGLKDLDEKQKLTADFISLYKKFVL